MLASWKSPNVTGSFMRVSAVQNIWGRNRGGNTAVKRRQEWTQTMANVHVDNQQ